MRLYIRTSKHTGVSLGWFGTLLVVLFWMAVLGLPIYIVQWSFRHWYTAPLGVLLVLALLRAALAWGERRS